MNDSVDFWNKRSKSYDQAVFEKYRSIYDVIIARSKKYLKTDDVMLDFACGTGSLTNELAGSVRHIRAIDLSDAMITRARENVAARGIGNVACSVTDIFDPSLSAASFNVVSAFNILQFIRDEDPLLQRIRDLLTPGGTLLAAVDCYPERRTPLTLLTMLLSKMGIFPYIRSWSMAGLEEAFRRSGFEVMETFKLCDSPVVSYFVAAGRA